MANSECRSDDGANVERASARRNQHDIGRAVDRGALFALKSGLECFWMVLGQRLGGLDAIFLVLALFLISGAFIFYPGRRLEKEEAMVVSSSTTEG